MNWISASPNQTPFDYYLHGSNQNIAETIPRSTFAPNNSRPIATTGVMTNYAIVLRAGQLVTNISFRTGSTAGSAISHWWVALYDSQATPALIAQSADQGNAAIAASTSFTLALQSPAPYTVPVTAVYYVSLMVAATTIPTIQGIASSTAFTTGLIAGDKLLASSSGSSLTTTAPGTIASASALPDMGYMVAS